MKKFFLFSLLFYILILGSCRDRNNKQKVRIGYVSSGVSLLVIKSMELEYQRTCGKDCGVLQFRGFAAPPALNNALTYGEIDVAMATSASSVALSRAQGNDVVYLFPNILNSAAVITKSGSGFESLDSLRGARVGWYGLPTAGGIGFMLMTETTAQSVEKEFQIKEAAAPLLPTLLKKDEVDAIVVFEPFVSQLSASNEYRMIGSPFWQQWNALKGYPLELSGTASTRAFFEKNKGQILDIQALWKRTVINIKGNPLYYSRLYAQDLGLKGNQQIELFSRTVTQILVSDDRSVYRGISDAASLLVKSELISEQNAVDSLALSSQAK